MKTGKIFYFLQELWILHNKLVYQALKRWKQENDEIKA